MLFASCCPDNNKTAPRSPTNKPIILALPTCIPKSDIPTIRVNIGVRELSIPATALLMRVSANGNSIDGIPFPKNPDAKKSFQK
jgi:hypothetical protein